MKKKNLSNQKKEKALFIQKIKYAVIVGVLFGLVIISATFFLSSYLKNKQEKAFEAYQESITCMDEQDFNCAMASALEAKKYGYDEDLIDPVIINISQQSANYALDQDLPDIALDQIESCLSLDPSNASCIQISCAAKTSLANRYTDIAHWNKAVKLLDEVIISCPYNNDARKQQETIFQSWYDDAVMRKNLIEAQMVKRLWSSRYSDN